MTEWTVEDEDAAGGVGDVGGDAGEGNHGHRLTLLQSPHRDARRAVTYDEHAA
jgi:hypothetical protein